MLKAYYQRRLDHVLGYIDANLGHTIGVAELSVLANFSKFHFHRWFFANLGVSVGKYLQIKRFKYASYQLVFRSHISITAIALDVGYASTASFSREFKKILGCSPSSFRNQPNWEHWQHIFDPMYGPIKTYLMQKDENDMRSIQTFKEVKIVNFPQTAVAVKEHLGAQHHVMDSVVSFIEWRKAHGVLPNKSATYNIFYDDPALVKPQDYRLDICAATEIEIAENPQGVVAKIIPAGRCAVYRHNGPEILLGQKIQYLYSQWLAASGETLRDFPCFIERVNLFPDVAEQQSIIDIYLPIE